MDFNFISPKFLLILQPWAFCTSIAFTVIRRLRLLLWHFHNWVNLPPSLRSYASSEIFFFFQRRVYWSMTWFFPILWVACCRLILHLACPGLSNRQETPHTALTSLHYVLRAASWRQSWLSAAHDELFAALIANLLVVSWLDWANDQVSWCIPSTQANFAALPRH